MEIQVTVRKQDAVRLGMEPAAENKYAVDVDVPSLSESDRAEFADYLEEGVTLTLAEPTVDAVLAAARGRAAQMRERVNDHLKALEAWLAKPVTADSAWRGPRNTELESRVEPSIMRACLEGCAARTQAIGACRTAAADEALTAWLELDDAKAWSLVRSYPGLTCRIGLITRYMDAAAPELRKTAMERANRLHNDAYAAKEAKAAALDAARLEWLREHAPLTVQKVEAGYRSDRDILAAVIAAAKAEAGDLMSDMVDGAIDEERERTTPSDAAFDSSQKLGKLESVWKTRVCWLIMKVDEDSYDEADQFEAVAIELSTPWDKDTTFETVYVRGEGFAD